MMSADTKATPVPQVRLIDVDSVSFATLPCCGIKSAAHPGRQAKCRWLRENAGLGLRARALLAPDGQPGGYIEYIPGEFAWRAVDASGYVFIHCIWVHNRKYQGRGWGRFMVDACLEEAREAARYGVAVMVRGGPWMADRRLFLAMGFGVVDTAPPDYELLARKFDPHAANPAFKRDGVPTLRWYGRGLTIIRSSQCPYIARFTAEIAETAENEYGIQPTIVELRSPRDAQNAPTPYAAFSLLYNGQLLSDHQISRTRFRNIMRKLRPRDDGPSPAN